MTEMLASVSNLEEALFVLNTSVDIIDLKQPTEGALGALATETVTQIVQRVNKKKPVSATVGDLPMQAELIFNAVLAMADTGVDYIKIGFFPGGDRQNTLTKLSKITEQGYNLIAVLFADTQPDMSLVEDLKNTGFAGVMLDTMDKSNGSLSQVMVLSDIKDFVTTTRDFQLLCGLAGSLKAKDIPELIQLEVDYLGFRGALCKMNNRTSELDIDLFDSILSQFKKSNKGNTA